jgi:predicted HD phosphohydrolase
MADVTPSTFTAMDHSTQEQWSVIATETIANQPRVAETVLQMLEGLATITDGFAVDQLVHSLQTATRAEEAGADEEVIVASLCHDLGKSISVANHPKIAAEILRPYVRPEVAEMIAVHQDFQGKHYYAFLGMDPTLRTRHEGAAYYDLAETFADDWDQTSFDPNYPTQSLEHFAPMVRRVFAQARSI